MSSIGAAFLADPSNSNVLRQSYVTGFLDVRGNAIIRTDASLSGNIGIGGAVSISNNIGMSGVINQLISIPLQGGFVYQQVNSADALTAIAQVATLNTLVVTGNAVASPALAPYSNPISGNVVTLGTASVNARLGGISNYVMGNLAVLSDVSLNTRLFLGGDASFGGKLSVSSDASFGGRISVGGDISVNGLSLGLGSQSIRTNTVFGNTALQKIQTSGAAGWINNTAVGYQSLLAATTPINNTAVGSLSLAANTTGANNTAVGYGAGAFVSTGGNITCLGYNTGFSSGATQYNNSTALGYNATIGGSNQVVLGTATESVIVAGNLAIGKTTTPGFALDVVGNVRFANDVSINGNLVVNGGLSVKQMQSQNIVNMTTTNYQLIVSEDISLNGKLFVSGDVSMGGNLAATSGSTANTYKNLYGKAPPSNVYGNLVVSPNTTNAKSNTWVNNNITWTSNSSTFYNSTLYSYNAFDNSNTTYFASTGIYVASTGLYGGTVTTLAYNTNTSSHTGLSGEWLQIQSSVPLTMSSYQFSGGSAPVQLPKNYHIVGSNDGINWNIIQSGSIAATPGAANTLISTVISITSATTSTAYGTSTITTTNYGSATTNAYTYFRLIESNNFNNTAGLAAFELGEWKPVFSVVSQPGPSRTLLYMDASNINQLDVSGSLGLINSNASTMTVTPNTTGAALSGWQNNNITWVASASNSQSSGNPYLAFNISLLNSTTANGWVSLAPNYNTSTGAYNAAGPAGTSVNTGSVVNISGDWLQIQSNAPVIMKTYYFGTQYNCPADLPKTFTIAGSNDGVNWVAIQDGNFTAWPGNLAASNATTGQTTSIYSVSTATTTTINNNSITSYSTNQTTAFTYFRLIIKSNCNGQFSAAGSFGYARTFWVPTFTPATSAVSMALDVGLPNQLNVGGAMNVAGTLSAAGAMNVAGALGIAGGITPMYSTPSFTSGQVGYVQTAVASGTMLAAGTACFTTTNLPIGVYIANWYLSTSTAGGYWQSQFQRNGATIDSLRFVPCQNATYVSQSASFVFINTNITDTYSVMASGSQNYNIYNGVMQFLRIA